MKFPKPTLCFKSFQEMKALLEAQSISFPESQAPSQEEIPEDHSPEKEEELFKEAMQGVTPIPRGNRVPRPLPAPPRLRFKDQDDSEPLLKLKDLVQHGVGFEIADTAEFIEGTGYQVDPEVARRLHHGDYSIQAFLNLHRFKVTAAKETLERFLRWAVTTGKTGVLIVHGRGLSSPSEPVLKQKVVDWLTRGPWRKWIVAYASARSCDGGAGATYVLLRRVAVSKRFKRSRGLRGKGKAGS